jgi:hypothetical protein
MVGPLPRTQPNISKPSLDQLATSLGLVSIALGAVELAAPNAVCRAAGIEGLETVIQLYGVREIATGVAILVGRDAEPWIWGRVLGDVADIATVGTGLRWDNAKRRNSALTLGMLLAVTAVDTLCAAGLHSEKEARAMARIGDGQRTGRVAVRTDTLSGTAT